MKVPLFVMLFCKMILSYLDVTGEGSIVSHAFLLDDSQLFGCHW